MGSSLIIFGTSRNDGNTVQTVDALNKTIGAEIVNLSDYGIGFYDYEHSNKEDGFMDVSCKMLENQNIIFATPVYWYAMSAQMKIFMDRFSDLMTIRKKDGRALAGKSTYLLASGCEDILPDQFDLPFRNTSKYFDMLFQGSHYVYTGEDAELREKSWAGIKDFSDLIQGRKNDQN